MSDLWYWNKEKIEWLWGQFSALGLSDNAIAGLFGNLYQESGICPYKCEGKAVIEPSKSYSYATIRLYTNPNDFIYENYGDGTGYSLAQWSYSRKGDFWNWNNHSDWDLIGTEYQMYRDGSFLIHDLQNWVYEPSINESIWSAQGKTVWQWLTDPNVSITDAVDAVLMCYEKPFLTVPPTYYDYSIEHNKRIGFANKIYNDFTGITPPPTPPIPPPPIPPELGIPMWVLMKLKENQNQKGRENNV